DHRQRDSPARQPRRGTRYLARRARWADRAVGDGRRGLRLPGPVPAPGRPAERRLGSRAHAVLRLARGGAAGAGRGLCPTATAFRSFGAGRFSHRFRRHGPDAHGRPGAPVLPQRQRGHAGRAVAAYSHQLLVQRRLHPVWSRGLPGGHLAARRRRAARRRGPDRGVRAADRDRGRPYRRPRAFRRRPRLAGLRAVDRRGARPDVPRL
ncbi:MAG: hypothetical protein AVDCRST_MAG05-2341, partial [uncultured Rubrobacteraceae bacterium]